MQKSGEQKVELTDKQVKLAEQLLLTIINGENTLAYSELGQRTDPPIHWRHVGREIGEVSKLCAQLDLPLISAKVVAKGSRKAGKGFYPLYNYVWH